MFSKTNPTLSTTDNSGPKIHSDLLCDTKNCTNGNLDKFVFQKFIQAIHHTVPIDSI